MANFTGQLNANHIFAALYNMIISQETFSDNIASKDNSFINSFKVDGTLYGDTRLYYSADVLKSTPWVQDSDNARNVLAISRPQAPKIQAIVMGVYRQIELTTDEYLSKQAWSTEGAFAQFNSVMKAMIRDTKYIYDYTTISTYVGTAASSVGKQNLEIPLSDITATGEEKNRLEAQTIAEYVANLITELKRPTRDYNDYGHMRSYNVNTLRFIWNSKYYNRITKLDLPTIFHDDKVMDKVFSSEDVMPAAYFGETNTSGGTTSSANTTIRSLVEKDYTVSGQTVHVFPGDLIPNSTAYLANETYTEDDDVIVKVIHRRSIPFMSAFEVGTSFYNPKNLSTNNYLTWGHNNLEYLKNYPMITVHAD